MNKININIDDMTINEIRRELKEKAKLEIKLEWLFRKYPQSKHDVESEDFNLNKMIDEC